MSERPRRIETLDLELHGRSLSTAAFLLRGKRNVLIETGPGSSLPVLLARLGERVDSLDWILVTHIHLDHAGAAGALAQAYPEAKVGVHPRGVRHLADPRRLWESARQVYGEQTERLWGSIEPVPPARLVALEDGDRIELGDRRLEVIHTPGHAKHHLSLHDPASRDLFAGDALGIQHPAAPAMRPSTTPPEFDLDLALASIERIRATDPERIWLTHFGPGQGTAEALCDAAGAAFVGWTGLVQDLLEGGLDHEELLAALAAEAEIREATMPPEARATVEATNSVALNLAGIRHSLTRLADRDELSNQQGGSRG